jgi:N-acetylglucosamine-6-phosphate deacetylase
MVCLATDANLGAGLPPGEYKGIGNSRISFAYEGAPARIVENGPMNGCLAGSGLTMDQAVRNAIDFLDLELPHAFRLASHNPAKVLGLHERKGMVKEGYDADLVLLDENLRVVTTWVGGRICYNLGDE